MKRLIPTLLLLALPAIPGCGTRANDASTTTPGPAAGSPPAAAAPAAGGLLEKSLYDDGPRAGEQPVDASRVAAGAKLFQSKGCTACHGWGKRMSGPDLKGVVMQRTASWMQNQILHPEVMTKTDPISHKLFAEFSLQMPNQGLTADEATSVIEYLKNREKTEK